MSFLYNRVCYFIDKDDYSGAENYITNIDECDTSGRTALFYAVQYDRVKCIRFLVEHGADVNHQDVDGCSILDVAKWRHVSFTTIKYLIEHGAKINSSFRLGNPAFWHFSEIIFLIEHGVDVNTQYSYNGNTILHSCVKSGYNFLTSKEEFKSLMKFKPNLFIYNNEMKTSMDVAREKEPGWYELYLMYNMFGDDALL